ncbi:MAG: hypothetical protein GQ552_08630 [Flavobacteriaceae bacterium]|nr:hypothetical protein [Flavobacteriaceae bacterium]
MNNSEKQTNKGSASEKLGQLLRDKNEILKKLLYEIEKDNAPKLKKE